MREAVALARALRGQWYARQILAKFNQSNPQSQGLNRLFAWIILVTAAALLVACSNPKNTTLPPDVAGMSAIQSTIDKLSPEEKALLGTYYMRKTVGAALSGMFGGKQQTAGIPPGTTIGQAIDDQRAFVISQKAEEEKKSAIKARVLAERETAMKAMRDAVSVTLTSKELVEEKGYSGMVVDEKIKISFAYTNTSPKDIAGVKGYISTRDLFGDEISGFRISNDATIKAGGTSTWTGGRSIKYAFSGSNHDRKLADLPDDKYKLVWEPQTIVFADGSKLVAPE